MINKQKDPITICIDCTYECNEFIVNDLHFWMGSDECKGSSSSYLGGNCINFSDYGQLQNCKLYIEKELAKTPCASECKVDQM